MSSPDFQVVVLDDQTFRAECRICGESIQGQTFMDLVLFENEHTRSCLARPAAAD